MHRKKNDSPAAGAVLWSCVGGVLGAAGGATAGIGPGVGAAVGIALGAGVALLAAWLRRARAATDGPAPTLALVMIARDEAHLLPRAVDSVRAYVDEIVIAVDSRTTDGTREAVPGARVIDVEFEDFAQMRTAAMRAARSDWILALDPDEVLDGDPRPLMRTRAIWELPRRHWMDLERATAAPEDRDYPDRQRRLFPNDPRIRYERPVHELVVGIRAKRARSPVIHHFKRALRPDTALEERRRLYGRLKERGLAQGFRYRPTD
jgi:hypothetical protein